MEGGLRFQLLTPMKEVASCSCDTVNLFEKDAADGWGGGSIGIRHGHLPAVVSLAENGPIRVMTEGKVVFSARVRGGFARVDADSVTVLSPEVIVTKDI